MEKVFYLTTDSGQQINRWH